MKEIDEHKIVIDVFKGEDSEEVVYLDECIDDYRAEYWKSKYLQLQQTTILEVNELKKLAYIDWKDLDNLIKKLEEMK